MVKSRIEELTIRAVSEEKTLLIVVSNRYSNEPSIDSAIKTYSNSIEPEGWMTVVRKLSSSVAAYEQVDEIIESVDPYANLIIGEDTPMPLYAESSGYESPSSVPFYTKGGEAGYTGDSKIYQKSYPFNIPTGLLFQNPSSYGVSRIVDVLNRFASDRDSIISEYGDNVIAFLSINGNGWGSEFSEFATEQLSKFGDLMQYDDPSSAQVRTVLDGKYKMVCASGHANPQQIAVRWSNGITDFYASKHANHAKTPFLIVDGCFTSGWRCSPCIAGELGSPTGTWFGQSLIFNPNIRVVFAGFPMCQVFNQGYGSVEADNFLVKCASDIASGKSIAESMKDEIMVGDSQTLFGDPTFHY